MLVDWVTVVAQIVNFLILAAVLKFLLYDRVVRALDERQGRIEQDLDDAARRKDQAEQSAREYREQKQQFEQKRDEMLQDARKQADQRREELEADARKEVDQRRDRWLEALRSRQESFLQDLRSQAARQLCDIAARTLHDLADRDLQQQVVSVFLGKIEDVSPDALESGRDEDESIVVRSAWDLEDDTRERIEHKLQERFDTGPEQIRFETDREVICGVEIRRAGRSIGWTVEAYLDEVTEAIRASIEEQTGDDQQRETQQESAEEPQASGSAKDDAESRDAGQDEEESR